MCDQCEFALQLQHQSQKTIAAQMMAFIGMLHPVPGNDRHMPASGATGEARENLRRASEKLGPAIDRLAKSAGFGPGTVPHTPPERVFKGVYFDTVPHLHREAGSISTPDPDYRYADQEAIQPPPPPLSVVLGNVEGMQDSAINSLHLLLDRTMPKDEARESSYNVTGSARRIESNAGFINALLDQLLARIEGCV